MRLSLEQKDYYLNARYYDPENGKFLTEDTYRGELNEPDTLHLYVYCKNNPINYVDPRGHDAVWLTAPRFMAGLAGHWALLLEKTSKWVYFSFATKGKKVYQTLKNQGTANKKKKTVKLSTINKEFTLGFQETHKKIDDKISKNLYQIRRQIKQYKTGERILSDDFYKMEEENPLFGKCAEFAKCYPEEISLEIYGHQVEYEEKDVESAVAFVPNFINHWCQEYDDISIEYEECRYCYAHLKELSKKAYIRPQGFIKKESDQYGVLWVDGEYERFMVLPR